MKCVHGWAGGRSLRHTKFSRMDRLPNLNTDGGVCLNVAGAGAGKARR